jgi:hypothetical protein
MLTTILIVLVALWLIGFITANTFGGVLHLLLIAAVVVLIVRLLTGRQVA